MPPHPEATFGILACRMTMALVIGDGQPVYGVPRSFAALMWFFLRYTSLGRSI
ncbi:MAG: hypothetical protein ACOYES_01075 [Bacillota bacterium]|jgi:hypothetical protein